MKFNSVMNMQVPQHDKIHNNLLNYPIIILVLVATFLSFLYLDTKAFWLDEAYSISFVNVSWSQLWDIISRREANMSLYYVLLKLWVEALGDSEFAARSLSVIFAVGGVIMTYAIGARLFNIRTGLTAGLVLTVNAFFISYAQEARGYTLLLLLTTFSMYLFIKVIERQQYRYYIALGLTNALVLYAHFFGFFILVAQIISLVFLPPRTIRWRRMLTCAILTASLAVPLGIFILTHEDYQQVDWIPKSSLRSVYSLFIYFTGNGGVLPLLSYFIPCFVSFVFAVQAFIRFKKSNLVWRYALLLCWLFVPILSLYLISMFKPLFVDRYMISSLPALVLLTGVGLSSFRSKALHVVAALLLIILSLHTLFYMYHPGEKEDWRSATRVIIQNAKAGDAIIFYSKVAKIPFEYYYGKMNGRTEILVSVYPFPLGSPIGVFLFTKVAKPSESMLESLSERYDRLWVVLAYDRIEGLGWDSRPIIRAIERKYINRENFPFAGINIKLYERY